MKKKVFLFLLCMPFILSAGRAPKLVPLFGDWPRRFLFDTVYLLDVLEYNFIVYEGDIWMLPDERDQALRDRQLFCQVYDYFEPPTVCGKYRLDHTQSQALSRNLERVLRGFPGVDGCSVQITCDEYGITEYVSVILEPSPYSDVAENPEKALCMRRVLAYHTRIHPTNIIITDDTGRPLTPSSFAEEESLVLAKKEMILASRIRSTLRTNITRQLNRVMLPEHYDMSIHVEIDMDRYDDRQDVAGLMELAVKKSVAVFIDFQWVAVTNEKGKPLKYRGQTVHEPVPWPVEDLEKLEVIVKAAVDFNPEKDEVIVKQVEFDWSRERPHWRTGGN